MNCEESWCSFFLSFYSAADSVIYIISDVNQLQWVLLFYLTELLHRAFGLSLVGGHLVISHRTKSPVAKDSLSDWWISKLFEITWHFPALQESEILDGKSFWNGSFVMVHISRCLLWTANCFLWVKEVLAWTPGFVNSCLQNASVHVASWGVWIVFQSCECLNGSFRIILQRSLDFHQCLRHVNKHRKVKGDKTQCLKVSLCPISYS